VKEGGRDEVRGISIEVGQGWWCRRTEVEGGEGAEGGEQVEREEQKQGVGGDGKTEVNKEQVGGF